MPYTQLELPLSPHVDSKLNFDLRLHTRFKYELAPDSPPHELLRWYWVPKKDGPFRPTFEAAEAIEHEGQKHGYRCDTYITRFRFLDGTTRGFHKDYRFDEV